MLTFLDWAKEKNLEIPSSEAVVTEKTSRTGYSANYPAAYVSGQYPHKYFNPIKATADLDKENMDKKKIVTPKE